MMSRRSKASFKLSFRKNVKSANPDQPQDSQLHPLYSSLDSNKEKDKHTLNIHNTPQQQRFRSLPTPPKIVIALSSDPLNTLSQSEEEEVEKGVGRVDAYSHGLLTGSADTDNSLARTKSAPASPSGGRKSSHENSALTLAKAAFQAISPSIERARSLLSVQDSRNCVTVVGPPKIGKSMLIQRLNLFSSSVGFLYPGKSPIAFMEVTGHADMECTQLCTGVVVTVFALNNLESLKFTKRFLDTLFKDDKQQRAFEKSVILVANKSEFRPAKDAETVLKQEILRGSSCHADFPYLEVSAAMNQNIEKLWNVIKVQLSEEQLHNPTDT